MTCYGRISIVYVSLKERFSRCHADDSEAVESDIADYIATGNISNVLQKVPVYAIFVFYGRQLPYSKFLVTCTHQVDEGPVMYILISEKTSGKAGLQPEARAGKRKKLEEIEVRLLAADGGG